VSVVPEPDLLTLTQVAERLQVSRWTVYQLIWAGELHSVHIGRCHRVRARDVDAYVENLGAGAA
jgi:excisionase family DNA binding protein